MHYDSKISVRFQRASRVTGSRIPSIRGENWQELSMVRVTAKWAALGPTSNPKEIMGPYAGSRLTPELGVRSKERVPIWGLKQNEEFKDRFLRSVAIQTQPDPIRHSFQYSKMS